MKSNLDRKIKDLPEFDNHKLVKFFYDKETGLKGFIALHNMNLGPAVGGTRYLYYFSGKEALRDVLRLSKAMTYKCALAGVPFGGGKGVIMANSEKLKAPPSLMRVYAKKVNLLKGLFYTGEDVGMNARDTKILAERSKFIVGRPNVGGSPSPWTALSVFYSIQTALRALFGDSRIRERRFTIKGLGHVGLELCRLLYEAGGRIVAADIKPSRAKLAREHFPQIKITKSSEIHKEETDVYSPCALGNELNNETISQLRCRIVCGGANNQLISPEAGEYLYTRNILYIPDYVANSGGLINVIAELHKSGYSEQRVERKIKDIKKTVNRIINLSVRFQKPTNYIADELAKKIFMKNR